MNNENINMITCGSVNCYVIKGVDGDILIDTGLKKYRDYIEMWLMNYNIKLIILTHGHIDHIQNALYFSKLYNCKIAMSKYDVGLAKNNRIHTLYNIIPMPKLAFLAMTSATRKKCEPFKVDIFLESDCDFSACGIKMHIVGLEGHTRGSIGVLYNNDLYAGDAVINLNGLKQDFVAESPKRAKITYEKICNMNVNRILCGHLKPFYNETK